MSRTHCGAGNHEGPLDGVASSSQVSDDHWQVSANPGHIFKQDVGWRAVADNTDCVGPHVAGVVRAELLSGDGERLAREPGSDDIHAATPRAAVEGSYIIPEGKGHEEAIFLVPKEDLCAVRIDLNCAHDSPSKQSCAENASTSASEQCQLIHCAPHETNL